jgi:flagellar motor switch protein FliG
MSGKEQSEVVGGVQPLVDIINRSDAATERALLDSLDERDPDLAEEIRSRMLTFADLVKLEPRDVQLVLRGVDAAVLALAMKGASETVVDVVRANVSERNRDILDDEIAAVGAVRSSAVEEARADIVRQIREMEAAGNIVVRRNEDDDIIY